MRPISSRAALTTGALALALVGAGTPAAGAATALAPATTATAPVLAPAAVPAATTVDQTPLVASRLTKRGQDARLGAAFSGQVVDLATGGTVWSRNAGTARLPASNEKLITGYVALTTLGSSASLTTPVLQGRTYRSSIYLKGVGDPTLNSYRLSLLAQTVAATVKQQGISVVNVFVDDTLFPPPTNAPGWSASWVPKEVAPVRSLVVDQVDVYDTSWNAGTRFASMLRARGLPVKAVRRGKVEYGSTTLATTVSPTVGSMVQVMLNVSHNDYAEMLFRLSALRGGYSASWSGARSQAAKVLKRDGIATTNLVLYDGSGLSRANRMPVRTGLDLVTKLYQTPALRSVAFARNAMPIAGTSGTLENRYVTAPTSCARNRVIAKTGSLNDVVTLSGIALGGDGRTRVFSLMVNNNTATTSARAAVDLLATTATGCY